MEIILKFIPIFNTTTVISLEVCVNTTISKIKSMALVRGRYRVVIRSWYYSHTGIRGLILFHQINFYNERIKNLFFFIINDFKNVPLLTNNFYIFIISR